MNTHKNVLREKSHVGKSSSPHAKLLRHEEEKPIQKLRRLISLHKKMIFWGFMMLLLIVITFYVIRFFAFYSHISSSKDESWGTRDKEQNEYTLLLMGYGGPGHDGAYLTDTMMVAHINIEQKRAVLLSVPRDVWVSYPTKSGEAFESKINATYQTGLFKEKYPDVKDEYGGDVGAMKLVSRAVEEVTGLKPDYFVTIDFSGFKTVVDTLGGVEVNVERGFSDYQYPIEGKENDLCGVSEDDLTKIDELEKVATASPHLAYPCRYEVLQFNTGVQKMDGETALKFVRSRHALEDGGDFNRARRQQLFIKAIEDKVLSIGFIPKILPLMDDLEGKVKTNIPLDLMQKFLGEAAKAKEYELVQVVLDTDNFLMNNVSDDGQFILTSKDGEGNWESVHTAIQNTIAGISPTLTPQPSIPVKKISQ